MVRYVRARDSRRVGDQSFGFSPSLSLSLSRLLPSFLAVSAIVSLSLFPSILSLFSHSFSFSLYPSSFLPLSPPLYLSFLLSFAFCSFRSSTLLFPFSDFLLLSLTFSSFLLWFHFPWFFPSLVFLPFSASPPLCPISSVLSLLLSLMSSSLSS